MKFNHCIRTNWLGRILLNLGLIRVTIETEVDDDGHITRMAPMDIR